MEKLELFIKWNKALFSYFFVENKNDEEVSLYINREKLDEIGSANRLGGYDSFITLITLSIEARQNLYSEIRKLYLEENMTRDQKGLYRSTNIFDFAKIFVDKKLYPHIDCPFLIYIVFSILIGGEIYNKPRTHIIEFLRDYFPKHSNNIDSLDVLFNELSRLHPQFRARRLTLNPYVGLIKYQLGLSNNQVDQIKKAIYCADISEDLPYELQIDRLKDYLDNSMRDLLRRSRRDAVLKRRISDLIDNFDPQLYEQSCKVEDFSSKGSFVLAVYEDDYSEGKDKLVLLTDVNNKSLSDDNLWIEKGTVDRLGKFAQYNINHVRINKINNEKAEMKQYTLNDGDNKVTSVRLGNIVLFSRSSSNYLIQDDYPQKGSDTYILVKHGHHNDFEEWILNQGNPNVTQLSDIEYVKQVYGEGWEVFMSTEIDEPYTRPSTYTKDSAISMNGGIPCPGKYKVYQFNALPYFEFPEAINLENLSIYININDQNLENEEFVVKVVEETKLVIDLTHPSIGSISQEMDILLEYKTENGKEISYHESISICDQDMNFNEEDLLPINLWGQIASEDDRVAYMKGFNVFNGHSSQLPTNTRLYQPSREKINIYDHRFFLINLIASRSCLSDKLLITDNQLKKCMRYAATRFGIDITKDQDFYRDLKYMLMNGGYINEDLERKKYQPVPPTFIKLPVHIFNNAKLFMLMGCYTFKFLQELKNYCSTKSVQIFIHDRNQRNGIGDISQSVLLPPVLLLQYNFRPEDFIQSTGCMCEYTHNQDVALSILNSMPAYQNYQDSLEHVPNNVFDTRLKDPSDDRFPRIRYSKATGYGLSRWIEMSRNEFYRITNPDMAWAKLYCMYQNRDHMLTKSNTAISLAQKMHLPVMMQRALFITNLGRPSRQKAFICNYNDSDNKYYNIVKVYDANGSEQIPHIVKAITGRQDNDTNPAVRNKAHCRQYMLKLWKNKSKHSPYPRSLMVVYDNHGRTIFGFAIKTYEGMKTYLMNNERFTLVMSNNMNRILSLFMTSRGTYTQLGITFGEETAKLPPADLYEIEDIQII